ncbi:hypothetical protein CXIVA_14400 [Clostridium sp. SY8519]|jgi:manganese transport protein|uniref:Nramp family divalent metal transporter n=1 Tax=Clostridium sp. (strain SY8519) TaxID=1042156 RepID=UPI0002172162|nr:Nramp family divalent metal transporter [Clostridium sp. SY8519]BAK47406.1 hypothetical protein CXIVA_14400 [Clostridium sp. SY8519]
MSESKMKYAISRMGPGFIVAATTIGAGSIVSFTNAGANFGFNLTWWLIVLAVAQYAFNYGMKKYTIVTGMTVQEGILKHYGKGWSAVVGFAAFVGQVIYGIGNFIAVGLGFKMLFPMLPLPVGGLIGLIACIAMYVMKDIYKKVEHVTKICSIVMIIIFVISLIVTAATRGSENVVSMSPVGMPAGSFLVMLALMGTTCNLSTQAWACNLVKQKGYSVEDIKKGGLRIDTICQIVVVIGVSACCLFIGAVLLGGTPITNGGELVGALIGLLGVWIRPVFGIGFLAAAWSSQIMAPQLGVDLVFDGLGAKRDKRKMEIIINVILLIFAAVIAITAGGIPAQLLTAAQVGGIICTPLLGVFAILLVNREEEMGEYRIKAPYTVLLIILYIIQVAVIINNLIRLVHA